MVRKHCHLIQFNFQISIHDKFRNTFSSADSESLQIRKIDLNFVTYSIYNKIPSNYNTFKFFTKTFNECSQPIQKCTYILKMVTYTF